MDNLALPNKDLGQHWLKDKVILSLICDLADISKTDTVVEIGPGQGDLTAQLINRAGSLLAIELDNGLIAPLAAKFSNQANFSLINEDIRQYDLTKLPSNYIIVANIPYYLTNYLLRLISETTNPPSRAVILVQKEVAIRIAAKPGQLSILGVMIQSYWKVTLDLIVDKQRFSPPPQVDSQVIKLERLAQPNIPKGLEKQYFQTIKIGFSQKRKTLLNSLSAGFHMSKEEIIEILEKASIDPAKRAQQLSLDDWASLTKVIFT